MFVADLLLQLTGTGHGFTAREPRRATTPMSTRGSRAMATGLIITLLAVSAGISFGGSGGGFGLLLSFVGILAGVNVIIVGVRLADDPAAPIGTLVFAGARALTTFMHRRLAFVGLVTVSSAFTAVAGETGPMLCFSMFVLLLVGVSLINIGVLGA
ncbi:unnamed protein product [Urochloa decumbens]|uniref:Uncharacterized protein n=1 Tax=Urochloa decumbens TaxID=240449 RepID=A0ABC9B9S5_9POAL